MTANVELSLETRENQSHITGKAQMKIKSIFKQIKKIGGLAVLHDV